METLNLISDRFKESIDVLTSFYKSSQIEIQEAGVLLSKACLAHKKILVCGNGGSAADSQHFVAELVSAFSRDVSRRPISAIALTADTSIITAYSNDFGFENVFARQVEAHGSQGDVLVVISTSGESKNCVAAVEAAKRLNMETVALTKTGSTLSQKCAISINVPSSNTQHIQESHVVAYHILSEIIERSIIRGDA
jgi:D-sedoheptulose 7-phosphate isomerase